MKTTIEFKQVVNERAVYENMMPMIDIESDNVDLCDRECNIIESIPLFTVERVIFEP